MQKTTIALGTIQETLLITLWARAVEAQKADPILKDLKSIEIMEQIDYDFSKLETAKGSQTGVCLRGLELDRWVKAFLADHPDGLVVEIGSGLNTRFERVDNGRVRWFDLDMPDSMKVRSRFFEESDRRTFIAASVLDSGWVEAVKAINKSIFFVAEGVLMYFTEKQVKQLFALLVEHFPGCYFAFDSMSPFMIKNQRFHDSIKYFQAKFEWGIENISDIQTWDSRYQVLEVTPYRKLSSKYYWRIGLLNGIMFMFPPFSNMYRLCLTKLG
ncbi:class I SAM-dependent methyltransferase [Phormidesmis priestleyi]